MAAGPDGSRSGPFFRELLTAKFEPLESSKYCQSPHMSFERPQLPLRESAHGKARFVPDGGSVRHNGSRPLTDHVWTFRELLTAKFEPLESQSISP